jgi:heme/copper-type cytochrome/quinol oxidase subunit 1
LKRPHKQVSGQLYNTVLTAHALLIIFFMVIPTLMGGFGNYLIPIMLCVPDLMFPRLNMLRYRLLPGGLLFLLVSLSVDGGCGTG